MKKKIFLIFFFSIFISSLYAEQMGKVTGFKIPRYVSLKYDESNLRIGPRKNYPKIITYKIANTPVEIIDEYENWRKIMDHEKNIGWIKASLLQGDRFAIVFPPYAEGVQIFSKPNGNVIGKIGKKNIVKVNRCLKNWCHIRIHQNKGWIIKSNLWGVYEEETFKIPFYQGIINHIWNINIIF